MIDQQLAAQLKAQWNLLWWAKPAERIRIIDETRKDMEFEEQLRLVSEEMASCVPMNWTTTSPCLSPLSEAF